MTECVRRANISARACTHRVKTPSSLSAKTWTLNSWAKTWLPGSLIQSRPPDSSTNFWPPHSSPKSLSAGSSILRSTSPTPSPSTKPEIFSSSSESAKVATSSSSSRLEDIKRRSSSFSSPQTSSSKKALVTLLFLLLCVRSSYSVSLGAHLVCARVVGLAEKQRAMCRANPAAVAAVGQGLRMAYAECRVQLAGARWNCSGVGDGNHFGHVMPLATREAAFTYAITSAGVMHSLSTACAKGDVPACGCNTNRRRYNPSEQFQWGGCGEAAYGARFARRFMDARELDSDARTLMNLHNNRVGRKTVKDLVRRECKCHGVSGSCALRTCWRALPQFTAVAKALRDKYRRAKLVTVHPPITSHGASSHLVIRRPRQSGVGRQPRKSELVFLDPSPSYCEADPLTGSLGTHGRHCNRTSRGEDGCETLCCGRGYNTVRTVEETKCRCQFHWCCRVTCDTCVVVNEVHVCK